MKEAWLLPVGRFVHNFQSCGLFVSVALKKVCPLWVHHRVGGVAFLLQYYIKEAWLITWSVKCVVYNLSAIGDRGVAIILSFNIKGVFTLSIASTDAMIVFLTAEFIIAIHVEK